MPSHPAVDEPHETAVATDKRIATALVYRVHSVEKTEAPGGGNGQDWYRYVLKNHKSTINGFRRGSRQHVSDYAAQYTEQLNTRALLGPSPWSPRGKKTAPRTR